MNVYLNRIEKIVEMCANKTVLDIGCADHRSYDELIKDNQWLHKRICDVAKKVVGIDYLEDQVEMLTSKGYQIYVADVEHLENLKTDEKFDLIVAGEIIEHLSNPGLFLDGIKRFLNENGQLLLSTPNCFGYVRYKNLSRDIGEDVWLNEEHSQWYSFNTLKQLLERHGYEEVDYSYCDFLLNDTLIQKLKYLIKRIINYNRINQPHFSARLFFTAKFNKKG